MSEQRNALAREIAERRTMMPAYLVDDETWAAAEAETDDRLKVGYEACWKASNEQHCRKPKGHRGKCSHI